MKGLLCDAAGWLRDSLFAVFGGWPNVMQGFGGALVAVLGAFYVARCTVHHELKRQNERARDAMGAEAASQVLTVVAPLPEALRRLEGIEPGPTGVGYQHVKLWEENQTKLFTQLRLHGMLLPADIETQATRLAGLLGKNLFDIDVDEDSQTLIMVENDQDRVQEAIAVAEATMVSLQRYRRDAASVSREPNFRRGRDLRRS